MKLQARMSHFQNIAIPQLPAMSGTGTHESNVPVSKVLVANHSSPAQHPAMLARNSRILENDIVFLRAAEQGLPLGKNHQARLGIFTGNREQKMGSAYLLWHREIILRK